MRTLEQWESTACSVMTGLSDGQIVVVARQAQEDEVGGMKRANVWHAMRVFRLAGQSCPCAVCVEAASAVEGFAPTDGGRAAAGADSSRADHAKGGA